MATTSSLAAPATAAAIGSDTAASITSETIAGSHVLKIDRFSSTKDYFGVGMSIKSSTFRVAGHVWYIECYPCGDDEESAGRVTLFLCRQEDDRPGSTVWPECKFTLMESLKDGNLKRVLGHPCLADDDGHWQPGTDFIDREELESLLKDDCFHVRCDVRIVKKFPAAVPQRDLQATTGETVAGSHMLTIHEYSKTRRAFVIGEAIKSCSFRVGEHHWWIQFYPCGEDKSNADGVTFDLCLDDDDENDDEVKVRFEMTLLTHTGQKISSTQNFHTFTGRENAYGGHFLGTMEHESSPLLQDGIHIRCDIAVVEGIMATPYPHQGIGGDLQGRSHLRGDVTFVVGGHLFAAHKCVLTTRCTAFMAEFCGHQAGKDDNAGGVRDQHVHIDDMDPRVFEALLHFIYTDSLAKVREEDEVWMARDLLVAADRFAMERLKLICGDMLCNYVNDAHTALDTLELAVKHGCHRLREACKKFLMDHLAKGRSLNTLMAPSVWMRQRRCYIISVLL